MNLKSILIKGLFAAVFACGLINSANAGVITSNDLINQAGGDIQNLASLEWLSWDETFGESRDSIENGFGNYLADGWRYAELAEVTTLIAVLGINAGWSADSNVQWLRDIFFPSHEKQLLPMFGEQKLCGDKRTCNLHVDFYELGADRGWSAYGPGGYGTFSSNYTGIGVSSILVRQASLLTPNMKPAMLNIALPVANNTVDVPEPASFGVWLIGLFAIVLRKIGMQSR